MPKASRRADSSPRRASRAMEQMLQQSRIYNHSLSKDASWSLPSSSTMTTIATDALLVAFVVVFVIVVLVRVLVNVVVDDSDPNRRKKNQIIRKKYDLVSQLFRYIFLLFFNFDATLF